MPPQLAYQRADPLLVRRSVVQEKEIQDKIERAAEQERKHGDRAVEALGGVTDSGDQASLIQQLGTLALYAREEAPSPPAAGKRPPAPLVAASDYAELQESVDNIEHRMTVKVSPAIAAGDLGIWARTHSAFLSISRSYLNGSTLPLSTLTPREISFSLATKAVT